MRFTVLAAVVALVSAAPVLSQDLSARVDSVMREAEARGFSGVVRIEKDGALVIEKGYGMANRAQRISFTPRTVVQIGSNTKDFTKVAILQLMEKGLLQLSDPLSKHFPSAPADKRDITIRQLMNHRAGFPIGLGPDAAQVNRQQLIDAAMNFKLLFNPGDRTNYSNTGYALLAAIIEQLSGKSYDEYVRDNIFVPLGLKDTGFHLPAFDTTRLAHGYSAGGKDEGTLLARPSMPDGPYWNLRGNGGMLSTVSDMSAFYRALFQTEKLIGPGARGAEFPRNEPVALAGSDLVNFFLYERDPGAKVEIIVASNNSEVKVPAIMAGVRSALGLVRGRVERQTSGGPPLAQKTGKPATPAQEKIARDFIAAVNSGNAETLRGFIRDWFVASVPVDERFGRLSGLNANLGNLEVLGVTVGDNGDLQIQLQSAKEGNALLTAAIESAPPHKIRSLSIMVGGD